MKYRKKLLLFLLLQIGLSTTIAQNNILQKGISDRWTKDSRTIQYVLPSRIVLMSDSEGKVSSSRKIYLVTSRDRLLLPPSGTAY